MTRTLAGLFVLALTVHAQTYQLGPDDQIMVRALHVPEIADRPIRIGTDGTIDLPLVGRMKAAGMSTRALETALAQTLKTYVQEPEVSVELVEQRSEPVSILGAVKSPGFYQLRGSKTLIEVLSLAGGPDAEAGYTLRISRRLSQGALPLPNAKRDSNGEFTAAEVNLQEQSSLAIKPFDIITVPRAKMVYVIGEVRKPGGFVLRETEHISVLQALSLAEGLNRTAGAKGARVMRQEDGDSARREIPVNLNQLLSGKAKDEMLRPGDILFVPNSSSKSAAIRSIEAAIQMATGLVIWRP